MQHRTRHFHFGLIKPKGRLPQFIHLSHTVSFEQVDVEICLTLKIFYVGFKVRCCKFLMLVIDLPSAAEVGLGLHFLGHSS